MINKQVTYRIQATQIENAMQLIHYFIEQVNVNDPGTRYYYAFQSHSDPQKFIHIMEFEDGDAEYAHRNASYTKYFAEKLYPLCEQLPEFTDLKPIY